MKLIDFSLSYFWCSLLREFFGHLDCLLSEIKGPNTISQQRNPTPFLQMERSIQFWVCEALNIPDGASQAAQW